MSGHGNDGAMPSMQLVRLEDVTHTAVQSGAWSDPATWAGGTVPPEGARVQIPEGLSVTVDAVLAPMMETVRVDGTLSFATDVATQLRVDTLVTAKTGLLEIGTAAEPVEAGVTASILFADDGPVSRDTDPALIGRGALLHGKTVIHGAEKTGFGPLAEGARAGDGTITLAEAPTGWRIGDRITIAGTDAADPLGDEVRVIAGIDGATVTLDRALDADHVAPRADLDVHVANLTRNVTFASESEETLHRGHVMFMHTNDAELAYVGFDRLGRSDKIQGLDDWELVGPSEGAIGDVEVMELGGDILRGRYSVHFHEGYGSVEEEGAQVIGSVVTRDPGWGFVNHSSNVDFIANVTHDIGGAAYVTEAGDEIGSFVGNIAIRTHNPEADLNPARQELDPGQEPDARAGTQDYGWQGDGFWLHGANVAVDGNVVSGASGHGYIYWTLGLTQKAKGETLVDVAILPQGGMIGPDGTLVRTKQVPVPSFVGNEAYSVSKGLQIHYLHTDNRDPGDRELGLTVPQAYEA
ncbi:MAG: G8 domain-containing protein, partial [Pseudomonadota bacterium]